MGRKKGYAEERNGKLSRGGGREPGEKEENFEEYASGEGTSSKARRYEGGVKIVEEQGSRSSRNQKAV